jgi:hypothetical protein
MMNKKSAIAMATFAFLVFAPRMMAQDKAQPQKAPAKAAAPATTEKDQNLKEYIKLEAAKFWPIYRDYDAELSKLNDLRVANIEEYSRTYNQLTNEKADELVHNAKAFQKQREDLLAKYYDRVKQELGTITAARFVQVENQLLLIIDLQIASSLPIAGS